ncbi:MAG: class I SAM-dependent methyltransferase [Lentisphaerota bacterium]
MKNSEKEKIIKRYSERLATCGYSPETLGWGKHRHWLRYHILLDYWSFQDSDTLLDFGCGFGDMHTYCKSKKLTVSYTGMDINPDLIDTGKKVFPDVKLICRDSINDGLDQDYDYIVSSGVHSLKLNDSPGFIKATFELFNQHAQKGFAINFMSSRVDYQDEHLYYADPPEILALALKFSNRVLLKHDYMPYEFTIFVDKRQNPDPKLKVYPEYMQYLASPQ